MVSKGSRRTGRPSPNQPAFVEEVLRPLAARAAAGEDHRLLTDELYEKSVHRWAMARARAFARGVPGHADAGEVTSQVLRTAWEACVRIDWDRIETWPALLERKVSHARIEAARSEDWLSRRERVYRRRYQSACAALEQTKGRELTQLERVEIARTVAPESKRVDWGRELVSGKHPSTVAEVPDVEAHADVADTVEDRLWKTERTAALRQWLESLAAHEPELADEVLEWYAGAAEDGRAVPAQLARRLRPFAGGLVNLLVGA
jgi:hypothetical protein